MTATEWGDMDMDDNHMRPLNGQYGLFASKDIEEFIKTLPEAKSGNHLTQFEVCGVVWKVAIVYVFIR